MVDTPNLSHTEHEEEEEIEITGKKLSTLTRKREIGRN
jgi:hypothetical protein